MIKLPNTLCNLDCETKIDAEIKVITDTPCPICDKNDTFNPIVIDKQSLCPVCEIKVEPTNNFIKQYEKITIRTSCFSDLIKNMVTKKFCNLGPTCEKT